MGDDCAGSETGQFEVGIDTTRLADAIEALEVDWPGLRLVLAKKARTRAIGRPRNLLPNTELMRPSEPTAEQRV